MNSRIEGQSCPVCHAYLFEEDDVVYCPVCGAPHHRDCYNAIGHCGLEDKHGTDEEYKAPKNTDGEDKQTQNSSEPESLKKDAMFVCPKCNRTSEFSARVCPYCGTPKNIVTFINIDMLGGVDKNADIGDGVTAQQAKELVAINTQRYIPKFTKLGKKKKTSWNWASCLFPEGWFLMRKMYAVGAIVISLLLASDILTVPLMRVLNSVLLQSYNEYAQYIMQNANEIGWNVILLCAAGGILKILTMLFCGIFGDWIYKKHILKTAKTVETSEEEKTEEIRKKGGVNGFLFILGFMITYFAPNIIMLLM